MAGSSSGQPHCSQVRAPQHHLCHSWRWENFPESDAETQETVNEREPCVRGGSQPLAFFGKKWFGKEESDLETGKTRKDHHSQYLSTFRQFI